MRYIKLKSLIERAAEFVNNSLPDHTVDLDKEKEKSGESKLMKGEWNTQTDPSPFHLDEDGNIISTDDQRQVDKPHIVNRTVISKKNYDGIGTDPFVPFN